MKNGQVVYFTKYALSSGISEQVLSDDFDRYEGSVLIENPTKWGNGSDLVSCKFIHETMEAASNHANQMRDKKIESLTKQIGKLKSKEFCDKPHRH